MKPISEVIFEHQVKVYESYMQYVSLNNMKVPNDCSEKRQMFVEWYMKVFDYKIDDVITDLSTYFLFISEQRTEVIIRNREKRKRKS